MRKLRLLRWLGLSLGLGSSLFTGQSLRAQTNLKIVPGEVVDDRFSKGMLTGSLRVELTLKGDGLDGIAAARFLPKEAKDDLGTGLLDKDRKEPSFEKLDSQMRVRAELSSPPRRAKSFRLSGKMELFVPAKDPNAVVKVGSGLAAKDKPLKSPGLKAAKVEVSVLSKKGYAELKKSQKLDDAKIAEIRAEGKKRGVADKEVDAMIELAKAFQEMGDADLPDTAVILSGNRADMDKIVDVKLQKADGTAVETSGNSSSSDAKTSTMILQPREALPEDAVLVFTLLTDKARVSIPVDLKDVPLP